MKKVSLTARELDIVSLLWQHGPMTVADLQARLNDDLAYTTVQTMLRLLELKRFVAHRKEGRAFRYHAVVTPEAVSETALDRMIAKIYHGSPLKLLSHLVSERDIDDAELRRMRELLDEHLKQRDER